MNTEIKNEWVSRLRSGHYNQTKGQLIELDDGNKAYCCLGVLCEIAVEAGIIERAEEFFVYQNGDYIEHSDSFLPNAVMDWAELDFSDPEVFPSEHSESKSCLSECNDTLELTFSEIANLVEEQL